MDLTKWVANFAAFAVIINARLPLTSLKLFAPLSLSLSEWNSNSSFVAKNGT